MTWFANHPSLLAFLCVSIGIFGREFFSLFFVGLDTLFFSLAVFSELLRGI